MGLKHFKLHPQRFILPVGIPAAVNQKWFSLIVQGNVRQIPMTMTASLRAAGKVCVVCVLFPAAPYIDITCILGMIVQALRLPGYSCFIPLRSLSSKKPQAFQIQSLISAKPEYAISSKNRRLYHNVPYISPVTVTLGRLPVIWTGTIKHIEAHFLYKGFQPIPFLRKIASVSLWTQIIFFQFFPFHQPHGGQKYLHMVHDRLLPVGTVIHNLQIKLAL